MSRFSLMLKAVAGAGALLAALGAIWTYIQTQTNVRFELEIDSSKGMISFADLAFRKLDQQTEVLCGGSAWETAIRILALKSCKPIRFEPPGLRHLGICNINDNKITYEGSSVVGALERIRQRLNQQCIMLVTSRTDIEIRPGVDARPATIQIPSMQRLNSSSQSEIFFCNCTRAQVEHNVVQRGAHLLSY